MTGPRGPRRVAALLGDRFGRLAPWQKGALLLGGGVLGFAVLVLLGRTPPRQPPPTIAPLVTTAPAQVRSGRLVVEGHGTVRPSAEVALAPEVGGRVVWVSPALVTGGRFGEGQVLARIDPADYENAVERARAEVAARRVDVLLAREEVAIAREEYRRLQARGGDAVPDSAEVSALLFREPQLQAAEAALQRAEAGLEDAELALARTRVVAPFDGVVRSETVDRGQVVGAGQEIARVYASESIEIVVALDDDAAALVPDLWRLQPGVGTGVPAGVVAEFGGRTYRWDGVVERAEGALDEATRTVDVVVRVPRPFDGADARTLAAGEVVPADGRPPLLLGTYTTVRIEGVELDRYVVVPRAALRDGDRVWAVRQDSLLAVVPVEVLHEVEERVQLAAPELADGDPIVVNDLPFAIDGMKVRLSDDAASEPVSEATP